MHKGLIGIIIIIALITGSLLYYTKSSQSTFLETIAYYPIDEHQKFMNVNTSLQLVKQNDEDEYTIEWKTSSEITKKMYLSHDISLLFEDGRLRETMAEVKENSNKLTQTKKIAGEDSGHFEAISFHYGQVQYPNDITKTVQSMSYDHLYILDSPLSPLEYFKIPESSSKEEGKRVLDTIIKQNLHYTWEELINYFNIPSENYHAVPLTNLHKFHSKTLPDLTMDDTNELIAHTWGSIYQYYFLGLEKRDGTIVSPIGSSVPLVLYHKTYSHIVIIFISKDGEKYHIMKNTGRF